MKIFKMCCYVNVFFLFQVTEEVKSGPPTSGGKRGGYSKGVATSFGFRKRATPPDNATTQIVSPPATDNQRITSPVTENLTSCDSNGNSDTKLAETTNQPISRLCATRLPAPKKEPIVNHGVSRFGFRQTRPATANVVRSQIAENASNLAANRSRNNNINNNVEKPRPKSAVTKTVTIAPSVPKHKLNPQDSIQAKPKSGIRSTSALPTPNAPAVVRCTMHSSQLPKPQVVRVRPVENFKVAKTAANNSRKEVSRTQVCSEESGVSSKEGSVTGDSGVGSQTSSGGDDLLHSDLISPEARPPRPRHLGTLVSGGRGVYDVRDLVDDEFTEDGVVTDVAVIPLPKLPSVFSSGAVSTGVVRERTREYQRQVDRNSVRNVSPAETRPLLKRSRDQGEEQKSLIELVSNEKSKLAASLSFPLEIDQTETSNTLSSSVPSNHKEDEPRTLPDWPQGGEAMFDSNMYEQLAGALSAVDEISFSEQSVIEAPVKDASPISPLRTHQSPLMSPSSWSSEKHGAISRNQVQARSVLVTIEDPFAEVAARSIGGPLLDDESSPHDSLISTLTEESDNAAKRTASIQRSSKSEEPQKELRSPLSPASPGTPTNTSLSLSEGRDFLIDDEIADQPALIFDDPATASSTLEEIHNDDRTLEEVVLRRNMGSTENLNDVTLINVTPKRLRRRHFGSLAASVDTLSPCESIASDDLMMDFEQSQSSGIDDSTDRYV